MEYICDAPGDLTWFRLATEGEAAAESAEMDHAVEKHFRQARDAAAAQWDPSGLPYIEQDIGKEAFVRRTMPMFLTLRNQDGQALATAMVPPAGRTDGRCIVVGRGNADPYPEHGEAIAALARHLGIPLDRASSYPYRR
mgnify:CR=1 FL=1|jgi:hypothetical protein